MGAIIDEIIDSLKKGQGKRVTNLVKMALDDGIPPQTILEDGFWREWVRWLRNSGRKKLVCLKF